MYDRRSFLRRAALAGAGTALLGSLPRPAAAADAQLAPFLHGVASGDPTASSVILWTRVTPDDRDEVVPVDWRVATDLAMHHVVASGRARATPARSRGSPARASAVCGSAARNAPKTATIHILERVM